MMRRSIASALCIALAGCGTLETTSPPDPKSGWRTSGSEIELVKGTRKDLSNPDKNEYDDGYKDVEQKDPEFFALFQEGKPCGPPAPPKRTPYEELAGAALIPIIITVVTSAISYWNVRQQRKLAERDEASKRNSAAQIVMSPAQFQSARCLVFKRKAIDPRSVETSQDSKAQDRKTQDDHRTDLIIVMIVQRGFPGDQGSGKPDHFSLTPIFARAYNSISQTQKGGDINLAVGFTLHQISVVQGVPTLASLGEASSAIQAVPLTGVPQCAPPVKPAPCSTSSILPLPREEGTIVFGLGVREIGDLGFEVDIAKEQAQAIAAALGPLAGALISGHYEREAARETAK